MVTTPAQSEGAAASAPSPTTPPRPPASRRGCLLAAGIVLVSAIGITCWGGYIGWSRWQVASYAQRCKAAWKAEDWQTLNRLATAWTELDESHADPWIYLADAAQKTGQVREAADYLARVPDRDPKSVPALLERTTLLFGPLNQPLEGEQTCLRILGGYPAEKEARQRLIFYYAQSMQRRKMVEQIREAMRYGTDTPENYVYLVIVDTLVFSNGAELNHHWLKGHPEHEDFLIARALHLIGTGAVGSDTELEQAVAKAQPERIKQHEAVLEGYLERFPHHPELLVYFLVQASTNGEVERVAELLQQAPESANEDNRFWRYKGWLLAARQRYLDAEEAYRKAMQLNPFDYETKHQLADVLRKLKRFDEVQWLERVSYDGKELRKELLQLPNARVVTDPLLNRIAAYATDSGDDEVAECLYRRIKQLEAERQFAARGGIP